MAFKIITYKDRKLLLPKVVEFILHSVTQWRNQVKHKQIRTLKTIIYPRPGLLVYAITNGRVKTPKNILYQTYCINTTSNR